MRELAHQKRSEYKLITSQIILSTIRQVYKKEGIVIDPAPNHLRKLKAAYFNDSDGCNVLLNMNLPDEPRLFAMIHELKHHYVDRSILRCVCLEAYDSMPAIEIGAEIFAAEFLFPESEFRQFTVNMGIKGHATPEDIVKLNYHSPARISYQFLLKRLEWLKLINRGEYRKISFHKLHAKIHGSPHYHQRIS
ncbi:MAG: ImmA/IrrE family metallo-endopeptidase [Actinobacteria bacterium]|nr:ImmA/IrrE family metallo-endopeptidase [Actinomycetota bacterium]